jgi:hypothetical protein
MTEMNDSRQPVDDSNAVAKIAESTERVYAPASARVPKAPAPGHEALVNQLDATTPERQAADQEDRPQSNE